jgi:hypothetical protein
MRSGSENNSIRVQKLSAVGGVIKQVLIRKQGHSLKKLESNQK